ncbi:hypothetical protein F511_16083 [Dorcoceras hygrometricum]|uniref:Uncharacterized protein n=1 Tax=Dorcoceras hygrometricum TaxID=472368 RepID=A0A2Z7BU28_9LAMI|nr:hypothetical protein F511_16083 [Dorcoceras hygrometricum]
MRRRKHEHTMARGVARWLRLRAARRCASGRAWLHLVANPLALLSRTNVAWPAAPSRKDVAPLEACWSTDCERRRAAAAAHHGRSLGGASRESSRIAARPPCAMNAAVDGCQLHAAGLHAKRCAIGRDGAPLDSARWSRPHAWPCAVRFRWWRRRRSADAPASLRRCRDGWSNFF